MEQENKNKKIILIVILIVVIIALIIGAIFFMNSKDSDNNNDINQTQTNIIKEPKDPEQQPSTSIEVPTEGNSQQPNGEVHTR